MILKRRLKTIAQPNDWILKPENRPLTHHIINPLMIKINKPNVTIVTGIVSKTSNGFKSALKTVRTKATGIAVTKLSISAPGSNLAVSQIEIVNTMNTARYDIIIYLGFPDTTITNSPFSMSSLFSI